MFIVYSLLTKLLTEFNLLGLFNFVGYKCVHNIFIFVGKNKKTDKLL